MSLIERHARPESSVAGAERRRRQLGLRPEERDFLIDALMLAFATLVAVLLASRAGVPVGGWGWLIGFSVLTLVLLAAHGMYRPRTGPSFLDDIRTIVGDTAVAALAITFIRVLFGDQDDAAAQAVREWTFSVVYLTAGRGGVNIAQARGGRTAQGGRRTIIVGAGPFGDRVAKRLLDHPQIGLRPVGFIDPSGKPPPESGVLPVLGSASELESVVREHDIEQAILGFTDAPWEVQLDLLARLHQLRVFASIVPRLAEGIPDRMSLERIGGLLPLICVYPSNPRGWQIALKYAIDRVVAAVLLLLISPLLAIAAVATYISVGSPVLFRQHRVGLDHHEFAMLKFRTMRPGTPSEGAERSADHAHVEKDVAPGGVEGADRRTRVGTLLRRSSLDELPQLLNVLMGQMSLVGPRPERPEFVDLFEDRVRRYGDRHRVKAGITGWAQVHGLRGKTSIADRVEWDNYYIENWSFWLDIKIVLLTVLAVFRVTE
jgi:exopolysaccharide biosynthesis polyprenyl glycosylphosphotransferase